MDIMANKALMIAVGIFITLAITSGVLMVIDNIRQIYGQVYETDTSITSNFDEFDKYEGSELLGIDLKNTCKKYKDNPLVKICNNNITKVIDESFFTEDKYSKEYKTSIMQEGNITYIIFKQTN